MKRKSLLLFIAFFYAKISFAVIGITVPSSASHDVDIIIQGTGENNTFYINNIIIDALQSTYPSNMNLNQPEFVSFNTSTVGTKYKFRVFFTASSASVKITLKFKVYITGQIDPTIVTKEITVNSLYYNVEKSGTFTRNNCGTGFIGSSVTYTVPAQQYSASTQVSADALATSNVNTNGQAYANANGTCTSTCPTPSISGAASLSLCGSESYQINNIPSTAQVSWSTTGGISISGSTTNHSVLVQKDTWVNGILTATILSGGCGSTTSITKSIGSQYYVISGSDQICNEPYPVLYYIANAPNSTTWTASGNISISGYGTNGEVYIVSNGTDGYGYLEASSCGKVIIGKDIMIGNPGWQEVIVGLEDVYVGNEYFAQIGGPYPGATSYTWDVPLGAYVNYDGLTAYVGAYSPGYYTITATAHTPCGDSYFTWDFLAQENYYYSYNTYPNPTSDELTVSYDKISSRKSKVAVERPLYDKSLDIKLYNDKGKVLKTSKINIGQNSVVINILNIPNGTYFLHITDGRNITKKQIIIKH